MRAALRRSRRGRSTQNYTHIHTPTHAGRDGENNPERERCWSQGSGKGDSGRMKKFGKKDKYRQILEGRAGVKKNSNSFTVAGRQMGKENINKNSGKAQKATKFRLKRIKRDKIPSTKQKKQQKHKLNKSISTTIKHKTTKVKKSMKHATQKHKQKKTKSEPHTHTHSLSEERRESAVVCLKKCTVKKTSFCKCVLCLVVVVCREKIARANQLFFSIQINIANINHQQQPQHFFLLP